jgi:hypothetical protein
MSRPDFLAKVAAVGGTAVVASWAAPIIERASRRIRAARDHSTTSSTSSSSCRRTAPSTATSGRSPASTASTTLPRGGTPRSVYNQYGYSPGVGATPTGYLNPFRLNTNQGPTLDGECINDPTDSWGPRHQGWNNGAMDQWVNVHLASEGVKNGPATMGHYTRADIPVHYALADAFTVCDHYHCSVLGPTDPNRLYWISATIDPDGEHGDPLLDTFFDQVAPPTPPPGTPGGSSPGRCRRRPAGSPTLPDTSQRVVNALLECKVGVDALNGTFLGSFELTSYPVPPNNKPVQESSPVRGTPSGPVSGDTASARSAGSSTSTSGVTPAVRADARVPAASRSSKTAGSGAAAAGGMRLRSRFLRRCRSRVPESAWASMPSASSGSRRLARTCRRR